MEKYETTMNLDLGFFMILLIDAFDGTDFMSENDVISKKKQTKKTI